MRTRPKRGSCVNAETRATRPMQAQTNTELCVADVTPAWMSFVFHLLFATALATMCAVSTSLLLSAMSGRAQFIEYLTLGPSFVLPIVWGLILGYYVSVRHPSRAVYWTWVVPATLLVCGLVTSVAAGTAVSQNLVNLFGRSSRCSSICLEQLFFSAPLVSSVAYGCSAKFRQVAAKRRHKN